MISPTDEGLSGVPPTRTPGGARVRLVGVGLAVLLLLGSAFLLAWIGQGSYTVAETYGGLGGGWAQILSLLAVGVGVLVGGLLVVAARLPWSQACSGWLSADGVSMTFGASHRPESMTVVELLGRRPDS